MRNTYTREKRTLCGESYMEVDLYAITPEEHQAKRRKKCRPFWLVWKTMTMCNTSTWAWLTEPCATSP